MIRGTQRTLNYKAGCSTDEDPADSEINEEKVQDFLPFRFIPERHLLALVVMSKDSGRFQLSLGDSDRCDITFEKKKLTSDFYKGRGY